MASEAMENKATANNALPPTHAAQEAPMPTSKLADPLPDLEAIRFSDDSESSDSDSNSGSSIVEIPSVSSESTLLCSTHESLSEDDSSDSTREQTDVEIVQSSLGDPEPHENDVDSDEVSVSLLSTANQSTPEPTSEPANVEMSGSPLGEDGTHDNDEASVSLLDTAHTSTPEPTDIEMSDSPSEKAEAHDNDVDSISLLDTAHQDSSEPTDIEMGDSPPGEADAHDNDDVDSVSLLDIEHQSTSRIELGKQPEPLPMPSSSSHAHRRFTCRVWTEYDEEMGSSGHSSSSSSSSSCSTRHSSDGGSSVNLDEKTVRTLATNISTTSRAQNQMLQVMMSLQRKRTEQQEELIRELTDSADSEEGQFEDVSLEEGNLQSENRIKECGIKGSSEALSLMEDEDSFKDEEVTRFDKCLRLTWIVTSILAIVLTVSLAVRFTSAKETESESIQTLVPKEKDKPEPPPDPFKNIPPLGTDTPTVSPSLSVPASTSQPTLSPTSEPTNLAGTILLPDETEKEPIAGNLCFSDQSSLFDAIDEYVAAGSEPSPTHAAQQYGYPMSTWCTSSVTNFSFAFSPLRNAQLRNFTHDLSRWDMSSATDISDMFHGAVSLNADLSSWNTSQVTNMKRVFQGTFAFASDLSGWDVGRVKAMRGMFRGARAFSPASLNEWDVSSVTDMAQIFANTLQFNAQIDAWSLSSVRVLAGAFRGARRFNQDLSNWVLPKARNLNSLFSGALSFDQDLCSWRDRLDSTILSEEMFQSTSCPHKGDPGSLGEDDVFQDGPFCYACLST